MPLGPPRSLPSSWLGKVGGGRRHGARLRLEESRRRDRACLLAVVAASAIAGRGGGMVESILSFLGLNFFFTEPHHTLAVRHASDVVALIAFLLSGLIVGALVSRVREERSRAERRATETLFLNRTAERFISSGPIDRSLGESRIAPKLLGLVSCDVSPRSVSDVRMRTSWER